MSDNQPSNCETTAGANAQEDQSDLVKNEQNELENRNENNVEIKMETDSPEKRPSPTENNQEDDDLEEGELKDDEDDDDDDEEIRNEDGNISDTCLTKTKSSDDESNAKSSSSSSSSSPSHCSDEESKEHNSSRSSSKLGSNKSYTNKRSDLSSSMDYRNNKLSSSTSHREERFRSNWEREREDPSEKAAKLISMRTKLLEARAREIEMKFQKHRVVIAKTTTTAAPTTINTPLTGTLSLGTPSAGSTQTTSQDKVKMTITKPSISYSENPHPPSATSAAIEAYTTAKRKLQSKMSSKSVEEKVRKNKKKSSSKKKKKTSKTSKKHKKHKSESVSTKKLSTSSHKLDSNSQDLDAPFDTSITNDHQGPRTPPDNHVLTLDDEQIEWPSHLIKMTITQPSISYSVNPKSVLDYQKYPMSSTNVKVSSKPDLNVDYDWYYNYFVNTVEMNHNQAQHQAYLAILSSGSYERETLVKWFLSRGLEILPEELEAEANEPPKPQTPKEPKETTIPIPKIESDENIQKEAMEKDKLDGETPASEVKIEPTGDESSKNEEPDSELKVSEDKKAMHEDHDNVKNEEVKENNKDEVRENDIQEMKEKDIQEVMEKDKQEAKEDENKDLKDEILCQTGAAMITKRSIKPIITIIKSQKEIVLPNGQTLPAGTIQKIVHPYPKLKSELLGPFFDMY